MTPLLCCQAVTVSHSPSSKDCLTSQWVASVGALPLQYKVNKMDVIKRLQKYMISLLKMKCKNNPLMCRSPKPQTYQWNGASYNQSNFRYVILLNYLMRKLRRSGHKKKTSIRYLHHLLTNRHPINT